MHPAERVGIFMDSLLENEKMEPFFSKCVRKCFADDKRTMIRISLISAFDYTNLMLMDLILWVFGEIPSYFQILRCSVSTTEEDIELFFDRMNHFPQKQYLIMGVDTIKNELQRVIS